MGNLSRRSVLRTSLAAAAVGTLARPYIVNAAATTAEVWWAQGFVPEEDVAIKKVVADYEKASGNTIDLTITPFAPQRQKTWRRCRAVSSRMCSPTIRARSPLSLLGTTS